MQRAYHRWHSPALHREMELLVFGYAGTRVLVFPTRMGRFFDYENFRIIEGARKRIEAGQLQLICVDSFDDESFYCSWRHPSDRIRMHEQYERYLLEEVIPFSERLNPQSLLISHGCSLGAYHAVNLAFRHPERFVKVLALSGRYDLTIPIADFPPLINDYFDELVYYHMPSHYVPNLGDPDQIRCLRQLHIVFAIGKTDPFLPNNQHLIEHLHKLGIPVEMYLWEGRAHQAKYWSEMVRLYL